MHCAQQRSNSSKHYICYDITRRGINILVHYEKVVEQTRLWWATTVEVINEKHWGKQYHVGLPSVAKVSSTSTSSLLSLQVKSTYLCSVWLCIIVVK